MRALLTGAGGFVGAGRYMRKAIIVLGMHRSGTSAFAGALSLLGVRMSNYPLAAQYDNPKGYFEPARIIAIHDRLLAAVGTTWSGFFRLTDGWLASEEAASFVEELVSEIRSDYGDASPILIKDPRMCRLMPIWHRVFTKLCIEARIVLAIRDPIQVARSLEARNKLPLSQGCLLWLSHLLEAEAQTRQIVRVVKSYDELLNDPIRTAQSIAFDSQLGLATIDSPTASKIRSFIESSMQHQRTSFSSLPKRIPFYPWLSKAYDALIALCRDPRDNFAQRQLDDVRVGVELSYDPANRSMARRE